MRWWNDGVNFGVISGGMESKVVVGDVNVSPIFFKTLPSTSELHVNVKQVVLQWFSGLVNSLYLFLQGLLVL
jgi:hypothetical protein